MKTMRAWSNLLKNEMNNRGINQVELGRLINKPASTVSHWVSGTRIPPTIEMLDVLKSLGVHEFTITADGDIKNEHRVPLKKIMWLRCSTFKRAQVQGCS